MQFLGKTLEKAAKQTVDELYALGGLGGVIALDNKGNGRLSNSVGLGPLD